MAKIDKHGIRIKGLKEVSGLTKECRGYYAGRFVEVFFDKSSGYVWGDYHCSCNSWSVYNSQDVIRVCNTCKHMTMQEIADAIYCKIN